MCRQCEDAAAQEACAFDADEHHPDQWDGDQLRDSNDRRYNPYQGSVSPTEGRCNATLDAWEDRYGEPRYCMALPESTFIDDGSEYCRVHSKQDPFMDRASDVFTHGYYSKTIRHVFEHLEPWQKLTALGWYDSYVQESRFEFDASFEEYRIDFSDYDGSLPLEVEAQLNERGEMVVGVPIPHTHAVRAFALYRAALADVKAGLADRALLDTSDGTAMERETVVGTTESGTVTDFDEHHLNLPLSRIDKDKEELLAFGGVPIDGTDDGVGTGASSPDQLILDLEETSALRSDPNPIEQEMLDTDADADVDAVSGTDGDVDADADGDGT